jgi:hypothetical protein
MKIKIDNQQRLLRPGLVLFQMALTTCHVIGPVLHRLWLPKSDKVYGRQEYGGFCEM